jgi:hypothetical protein
LITDSGSVSGLPPALFKVSRRSRLRRKRRDSGFLKGE